MEKPEPKSITENTVSLQKAVEDYISFIESDDYHSDNEDDYKNDIFERAVEVFYKPDIWDYLNEVTEEKD